MIYIYNLLVSLVGTGAIAKGGEKGTAPKRNKTKNSRTH